MSRHRVARRGGHGLLWTIALTGSLALAAVLALGGTFAAFTDAATTTSTGLTSGAVATPAAPTTTQTSTTAVTLSWAATTVGNLGGTATGYTVTRYDAATGGSGTVVCSTTGALSCADTAAPAAGAWYALRATFQSWTKDGPRTQYVPDTTGPTLTISANASCGTAVGCGTAADPAGVTLVEYTLRRVRTPLIGASTAACWNGSSWVTTTGGCSYAATTGTTSWTVPGSRGTAYTSAPILTSQSYTLSVRATDGLGNVSLSSSSY